MNMWTQAAQDALQGGAYNGFTNSVFPRNRSYNRPAAGFPGMYNPGFGMVNSGINTMNNLGANIGGAFALANAQSGQNMANQVPIEVERMRQQGLTQRLSALSPLLAGIFGGINRTTQPRNIQTNYGAGVNFS